MTRSRKKAPPPKRGRGRPPLDPEYDTVPLRVSIAQRHYLILRRLIDEGHGPTMSDAVRWAIEQAP